MFKISKNNLKYLCFGVFLLILIPRLVVSCNNPLQKASRPALSALDLLTREINGLLSYHRNYLENERLRNEASLLRNKFVEFKELYQENIRLKNMLALKQKSVLRLIAARVIARSPDSWSSSALIDKGRYNGIRKGMVVINCQGLVGRISETSDSASKVTLINDPSLGISAVIQRSRQEGLVSGTLGGNLIMHYLSEEADIAAGDIVITSELSESYPKGLVIGKIIHTGNEFSGLNRYALIKPSAELANVEEVFVIIP